MQGNYLCEMYTNNEPRLFENIPYVIFFRLLTHEYFNKGKYNSVLGENCTFTFALY